MIQKLLPGLRSKHPYLGSGLLNKTIRFLYCHFIGLFQEIDFLVIPVDLDARFLRESYSGISVT